MSRSALYPLVWAFVKLPLGMFLWTIGMVFHLTIILSPLAQRVPRMRTA